MRWIFLFLPLGLMGQTSKDTVFTIKPGVDLHATLLLATEQPAPVALIIAGSGPTDRNGNNPLAGTNNSLKQLAEGLAERGIHSLRYDKRGIGASAAAGDKEEDLRFDDMIDDAAALARFLKTDGRFQQVYIIGHSEGSLVGINAAFGSGADGVVSLAGPSQPAAALLRMQLSSLQEPLRTQAMDALDTLEEGRLLKNYPVFLGSLFRPGIQPYLISWFAHQPVNDVAKLQVPFMAMGADRDVQVPGEQATYLAKSAVKGSYKRYPTLNHLFKEAPEDRAGNLATYGSEVPPFSPVVVGDIADFILQPHGSK